MNKQWQEDFYKAIGRRIHSRMKEKKLSVSRLAAKSGQQYNTVKAVMEGRPFYFHQATWIHDHLDMPLSELINRATNDIIKEGLYGKQESKKESKKENRYQEKIQGIQGFL